MTLIFVHTINKIVKAISCTKAQYFPKRGIKQQLYYKLQEM